ncbi:MAG: Protein cbp3, mitochondrial [Sclerophora amabilis]|nr:MAG: Protein cbp3, mitochondrial [Sclerophora amabilis]
MASLKQCSSRLRPLLRSTHFKPDRVSTSSVVPLRAFVSSSHRLAPAPEAHKTQSVAPIIPPKSDPPSQNVDYRTEEPSRSANLANEVRRRAPRVTETYIAFGVTEELYKKCAQQANYTIPPAEDKKAGVPKTSAGAEIGIGEGWWYEELKLTPTFITWAQITMLHLYLLATRFRMFSPDYAPAWQQHLLDHFFYDAEHRMTTIHNMSMKGARNKYLKDLFLQYRGAMAAYDEGLCRGDAVLGTALWRNIFEGEEDVDLRGLSQVVSYTRKIAHQLQAVTDEDVTKGNWDFPDPRKERGLVAIRSKLADEPFRDDDFDRIEEMQ